MFFPPPLRGRGRVHRWTAPHPLLEAHQAIPGPALRSRGVRL